MSNTWARDHQRDESDEQDVLSSKKRYGRAVADGIRNGFRTPAADDGRGPMAFEGRRSLGRDNDMSYRTVAILSAVVSVIYGVGALLVPNAFASVFGITFDAVASYEARLLGGAYLGYGIVSYLTRGTPDRQAQRAVAAGNAFAWAVSLIVTTLGQLQGLGNALNWTTVVLTLVFMMLWGWVFVAAGERSPATGHAAAR